MKKINSITILGRRWFQQSGGNTYFSSQILVNGKLIHVIPFQYGYDNHYLQASFEWLDQNGWTYREKYQNSSSESPWRYCKDKGIELHYSATDVQRKKDL